MITIFNSTFVLITCQQWLEGDRRLSLRQLDVLYYDAVNALLGADVTADLAPNVRRLLDGLDNACDAIMAEVSA